MCALGTVRASVSCDDHLGGLRRVEEQLYALGGQSIPRKCATQIGIDSVAPCEASMTAKLAPCAPRSGHPEAVRQVRRHGLQARRLTGRPPKPHLGLVHSWHRGGGVESVRSTPPMVRNRGRSPAKRPGMNGPASQHTINNSLQAIHLGTIASGWKVELMYRTRANYCSRVVGKYLGIFPCC